MDKCPICDRELDEDQRCQNEECPLRWLNPDHLVSSINNSDEERAEVIEKAPGALEILAALAAEANYTRRTVESQFEMISVGIESLVADLNMLFRLLLNKGITTIEEVTALRETMIEEARQAYEARKKTKEGEDSCPST